MPQDKLVKTVPVCEYNNKFLAVLHTHTHTLIIISTQLLLTPGRDQYKCKYCIFTCQQNTSMCGYGSPAQYWHPQLSFSIVFVGCGRAKQPVIVHTRYMFISRQVYLHVSKARVSACPDSPIQSSLRNPGVFGSDIAGSSTAEPSMAVSDGALQCGGWKPHAGSGGLQPAATPWSPSDYTQHDRSAQALAYSSAPTLTADVYMQTLCPSYTMLTYTHAPLLTNFGVSRTGEKKVCARSLTKQDFAKMQMTVER